MVSGEYYNYLGIVYLDADGNQIETSSEIKNAFLHEDIHFVQNYTTLYGINKSIHEMSILLKYMDAAREGFFDIKLSDEEDVVKSSFDIMKGDCYQKLCHAIESIDMESQMQELHEFYETIPEHLFNSDFNKDTVRLTFHNGNENYQFGGDAINESVAFLFEKILLGSEDYSGHQLPYNACELVYERIWEERCIDYRALLVAGYLSLMTRYPGVTFVELINNLKQEGVFSVEAVEHAAKNVIRLISVDQLKLIDERIDLLFPLTFNEVESAPLFCAFMEKVISSNEWLKSKYHLMQQEQLLFTDAFLLCMKMENTEKCRKAIESLLYQYGKPLVIDKNGAMYDKDQSRLMLLAPLVLNKILVYKEGNSCSIYNVCKKYGGSAEEICKKDCSSHVSDISVCIVRYYLYLKGLGAVKLNNLI